MPLPRSHHPLYSFPNAHRRATIPNNAPPTISQAHCPMYIRPAAIPQGASMILALTTLFSDKRYNAPKKG